jgi:hypothetical protein
MTIETSPFRGKPIWAFLALLVASGCASARMSDHTGDNAFRQGRYDEAAKHFQEGVEKEGENGRDLLLYLLDLGLSLHSGGKYAESNKAFLKADKIAEIKDYTSLSAEGATLLTSENIKDYKGEDFEKVLINTYLAMNYALMGDPDNALVEARRVNRKLYLMITDGQRKYKQNVFARYLSAILYESENNYNDAYVDYKNAHDLDPGIPGLGRDLWRSAKVGGFEEDLEKWDSEYGLTKADHDEAMKSLPKSGHGEIIILYENGISPIKRPNPQFKSLPKFYARFNPVSYANVFINNQPHGNTIVLDNIEKTAITNLDEKYGALVAKKVAGVVAKGALGYGVAKATNNVALGELATYLALAADQADLRSWFLLPRDLQIARIPIDPGSYEVRVAPVGGPPLSPKTIQVTAGKKTFVDFRFIP